MTAPLHRLTLSESINRPLRFVKGRPKGFGGPPSYTLTEIAHRLGFDNQGQLKAVMMRHKGYPTPHLRVGRPTHNYYHLKPWRDWLAAIKEGETHGTQEHSVGNDQPDQQG